MNIQELLGVEVVDEKEQQKKFLRDRIEKNIIFANNNDASNVDKMLGFPTIHDIPALSSQSIHDLAAVWVGGTINS